jgi:hypothetical protein
MKKRAGQVTLFIILAIAIIALIGGYAFFKYQSAKIPTRFAPVEQSFIDCVQVRMEQGAALLGEHGGYIYPPAFEPGSPEYPTSNQLDFMGDGVPYWFYVAGNGVMKENIPSTSDMQNQLSTFLKDSLARCDFSEFRDRGFDISLSVNKVSTTIRTSNIRTSVDADLVMKFENDSATVSSHNAEINSKLGKFYALALKIFSKEKEETFLENLAVDVLYLYAPTTDSELSCSPKVWRLENISNDLKNAFEGNLLFLRPGAKEKYFNLDISTESDENVRFLYSRNWPTRIYTPSDNGLLIAKPAGSQQGLGILGFCIVPYHFVYDIVYPTLIQIHDEREFFQFPVNVVIKGNKPRQALPGTAFELQKQSACQYKNTRGQVYTYDAELNPIEADISYKCFSEECSIGKTEITGDKAVLDGMFPQCINGLVIANAEGYVEASSIVSSNYEFDTGLILNKLHELNLDVKVGGKTTSNNAIIYFNSDKYNQVAFWPEQKSISLAEAMYNVTVYVYSDTSITLPETKSHTCIDVPRAGILGFLGATTEKCFDATVPEQKIQSAIVGGGKSEEYLLESMLKGSTSVEVGISGITIPDTIEDVQAVYDKISRSKVDIILR